MESMSLATRIYVGLVISAGLINLGWAVLNWQSQSLANFSAYLLASMLAATLKVKVPGVNGTMSVNFLFVFLAFLDLGFQETVLMSCAATLTQCFWKPRTRPRPIQVAFSVAAMGVASAIAFGVYHSEISRWLKNPNLILGLAASSFFVANTAQVAIVIALAEKKALWKIWRECYFWSFPYYVLGGPAAALLSRMIRTYGWLSFLWIVPLTYLVYRSYLMYVERLEREKAHANEMAERSKQLQKEVTERQRAEAILRESEEHYRTLFESNPHPMWVYDPESLAFMEVNDAAVNHYGYSREEFLVMTVSEICDPAQVPPEPQDFRKMLDKIEGESYWVHRCKDGSPIDVRVKSHRLVFSGRPGVLVLADDVTEQKQAEQLRLDRDAAEAANRAKSEFLANMSHELRTPLNAVIGYSEILEEEAVDRDLQDFVPDLKKIQSAGRHLLGLINDILDLSKIEAGKMELELEEFDIGELVGNAVSIIKPLAHKNNNILAVRCDKSVGRMAADLVRTRQILFNLLSNACKFTSRGEITLEVQRQETEEKSWIEFRVRDTGIGMTAEQIEKLCKPFTQADTSTTRKYGGTGLGLAISLRFCQMMGGSLEIDSMLGEGSTFTVLLPAEVQALTSQSSDATELPIPAGQV